MWPRFDFCTFLELLDVGPVVLGLPEEGAHGGTKGLPSRPAWRQAAGRDLLQALRVSEDLMQVRLNAFAQLGFGSLARQKPERLGCLSPTCQTSTRTVLSAGNGAPCRARGRYRGACAWRRPRLLPWIRLRLSP